MELLPIVYISLAVFSVIAVVVIIISYISFKVRQKYGNYEDDEILVDLKPSTISPAKKAIEKKRKTVKYQIALRRKSKIKLDKKGSNPHTQSARRATMSRLEILNPIKSTKVDVPKDVPKKNRKTLADEDDILRHYSDKDDDNFYTIRGTKSD